MRATTHTVSEIRDWALGRRPTCRYLTGRGQQATRCTAEPVQTAEDGAEIELCSRHLALALELARHGLDVLPVPDLGRERPEEDRQTRAAHIARLQADEAERKARTDALIDNLIRSDTEAAGTP